MTSWILGRVRVTTLEVVLSVVIGKIGESKFVFELNSEGLDKEAPTEVRPVILARLSLGYISRMWGWIWVGGSNLNQRCREVWKGGGDGGGHERGGTSSRQGHGGHFCECERGGHETVAHARSLRTRTKGP